MADVDLATLGLSIDSSPAEKLTGSLNDLVDSAERAESSVEGLAAAGARAGQGLSGGSRGAQQLAEAVDQAATSFEEAEQASDGMTAAITRSLENYYTMIGQLGLAGKALEQFTAIRRAGASLENEAGRELAETAGLYYDLAEAAKVAAAAVKEANATEAARTSQAGRQFQQRLNENFGIAQPAGDPAQKRASDSASVFRDEYDARDRIDLQRRQQAGDNFKNDLSSWLGMSSNSPGGFGFGGGGGPPFKPPNNYYGGGGGGPPNDPPYDPPDKPPKKTPYEQAQDEWSLSNKSAKDSAAVFMEVAAAEAQAAKEAAGYEAQAQKLIASLDPLAAAQQKYNAQMSQIGDLFARGNLSLKQYTDLQLAAGQAQSAAVNKATSPTSGGGTDPAMQARAERLLGNSDPRIASEQKFNATLKEANALKAAGYITDTQHQSVMSKAKDTQDAFNKTLDETGKQAGLSGQQMFWLLSNVKDFGNQVMAGGSLVTAGMQQGPMLFQILAMAKGGVGAGLESVVGKVGELALGAGGVATGVVAVTAALAALEYRGDSIRSGLERSTYGVGRRTGLTGTQIDDAAMGATNAATGMSQATARSAAEELAKAGTLTADSFKTVLSVVRDYAYTTDQDAVPAAKELAAALGNGVAGADALNAKLGFMNSATRETYQQMLAAGDKTGAQKLLIDALVPTLERASEKLNIFARGWNLLKSGVSNAIDTAATGLDRIVTGGSVEDQLAAARARLETLQKAGSGGRFGLAGYASMFGGDDQMGADRGLDTVTGTIEDAQKEVDRLQKKVDDVAKSFKIAAAAAKSIEVDNVVKAMNPLDEQIKKMIGSAALLKSALADASLPADKIRETESAVAALSRQMQQLSLDAKAGGQAFREMVTQSEQGLQMVGKTDYAKSLQQIQNDARKAREDAERAGVNTNIGLASQEMVDTRAKLQSGSLTDAQRTALEQRVTALQTTVDGYRAQLESIDKAVVNRTTTVTETERLAQVQKGGAFAGFSPEVQQQILGAATGSFSAGIIAAIAKLESGGNLDVGYSKDKYGNRARGEDGNLATAYGLGQINAPTERAAKAAGTLPPDYDRMNRDTMAQGIAGVLEMKRREAGGDVDRAIMNYLGSSSSVKNQQRLIEVRRLAGEEGDPSTLSQARTTDASSRAVRDAEAELKTLRENYDKGTATIEAVQAAEKQLNQLRDSGVTPTKDMSDALIQYKRQIADAAQATKVFQFNKGIEFDTAQLGRTSTEAAAYSKVQGVLGETTSPQALTMIDQAKSLAEMQQLKQTASDVFGTITSGIRSGASASDILVSALGKVADKLISMASDQAISGLFKMLSGEGSGGGFGGLGSLFGGAGSAGGSAVSNAGIGDFFGGNFFPSFANGGIMTSQGPVPLRKYAGGGVASTPQVALFGEGAQNEAFVPLPDGRRIPVSLDRGSDSGAAGAGTSFSPIVNVNMNGSSGDARQDREHAENTARAMKEQVVGLFNEHVAKESRPGGALYQSGSRRSGN